MPDISRRLPSTLQQLSTKRGPPKERVPRMHRDVTVTLVASGRDLQVVDFELHYIMLGFRYTISATPGKL